MLNAHQRKMMDDLDRAEERDGVRPMSSIAPDHRVRLCDGSLWDPWDPCDPVPAPAVFAFGASNICRYGGHVSRFLSVAEHTLWMVVRLVSYPACGLPDPGTLARLLRDRSPRWSLALRRAPPQVALRALLGWVHDVPEGLGLVDVLKPVKDRPEMAAYSAADLRCLRWVCVAWGLPPAARGVFPEEYLAAYGASHDEAVALWAPVWAADAAIMGAEMAVRPFADGSHRSEKSPPWPWLDLAGAHVLDDGETPGAKHWVRIALCQAWDALRAAAGLPELPAALPGKVL